MRKMQWLIVVLALSLLAATPSLAAEKTLDLYMIEDVDPSHGAYEQLARFLYADIIDGQVVMSEFEDDGDVYEYTSVLLKPENPITRAQFTKMLVNALGLEMDGAQKEYKDVAQDAWYYEFVQIASSHGIIQGQLDGTFRPNEQITRAHMALMIYRAFSPTIDFVVAEQSFMDVAENNSAYDAIAKVANLGIVKGYGEQFKPDAFAKRSHAVVMIDRALHLEYGVLTEEEAILNVVERNVMEEFDLLNGSTVDVAQLEALYRETTTGYLLASSMINHELYADPEYGLNIKLEKIGEHETMIASLNKRFAVVRIDHLKAKMTMGDDELSLTLNMDISGDAYLKKMQDGAWKVYHIQYDDEDYNLQ